MEDLKEKLTAALNVAIEALQKVADAVDQIDEPVEPETPVEPPIEPEEPIEPKTCNAGEDKNLVYKVSEMKPHSERSFRKLLYGLLAEDIDKDGEFIPDSASLMKSFGWTNNHQPIELETTYKVSKGDCEDTAVFKISIVADDGEVPTEPEEPSEPNEPVEPVEPPTEPEIPIEPEEPTSEAVKVISRENRILKVKLTDDGQDHTREIRGLFKEMETDFDKIIFEGKIMTTGMLPEDLEKKLGNIGSQRIFRLEGLRHKEIIGGDFYNPKETFLVRPEGPLYASIAQNCFYSLVDCHNVVIKDFTYRGPHDERRDTGYPRFFGSKEFEHVIDVEGCTNILIYNSIAKGFHGDFVYFRAGNTPKTNNFITIINCAAHFNGRQGIAWGYGSNVYIDGMWVGLSGRGGIDIEPPTRSYIAENVIVKNSFFRTWLLPFPMGGRGIIDGALFENNRTITNSMHTLTKGDRVSVIRKNIIFRGNKSFGSYGSNAANYDMEGVENLLLENENTVVSHRRSLAIAKLDNCRNVTIRNNDFVDGKYLRLIDTPENEVKVYGNKQKLELEIYNFDKPWIDPPNIMDERFLDVRDGKPDSGMWTQEYNEWLAVMQERMETRLPETVIPAPEFTGEDTAPKDPDFTPYWGEEGIPIETTRLDAEMLISSEEMQEIFIDEAKMEEHFKEFIKNEGYPDNGKFLPFDWLKDDFKALGLNTYATRYAFDNTTVTIVIKLN